MDLAEPAGSTEGSTAEHSAVRLSPLPRAWQVTAGHAGRTFSALGREGVNIIAIAQGSSEYNISFVIEASAASRAVAAIHREFGLEHPAVDQRAAETVATGV